jgi:hypothetical protein
MLGAVEAESFGLLKVRPKDEHGNVITDYEAHIIYDNGVELKEWVALAQYLQSFEPTDGVPRIPDFYNQLHGRKIEEPSRNIFALLKAPNHIAFLVLAVVLLLAAIITIPTWLIIRKVRRRKKKANTTPE